MKTYSKSKRGLLALVTCSALLSVISFFRNIVYNFLHEKLRIKHKWSFKVATLWYYNLRTFWRHGLFR